jgi:hypothetical protein
MTASHERIDQWIDNRIADARTSDARIISLAPWPWEGLVETQAPHILARIATCFPECRGISFHGDLGDAWLVALAAQAQHLPALQSLGLSGTEVGNAGLRALAAQAQHLPALHSLDLRYTKVGDAGLQALAEVAHQLPSLRSLEVGQTPASLPDEVKSSVDAQAILSYIRDRLSAGRPLGESKLLLVGQGEVGKTHLRKRVFLPDNPDVEYHNADEDRTHDADRCDFVVDLSQGKAVAGRRITVRVWDFGGQSYLHSTHRFFLGGQRCFYLLVLRANAPTDGEADDSNRLSYWLRLLAHYGQDSQGNKAPVIVVVSQCDRVELAAKGSAAAARHDELLEALRTAAEQGWYGANVVRAPIDGFGWSPAVLQLPSGVQSQVRERHGQATEAIRRAVQDHVEAVPDIGNPYPSQFFRVKALIEEVFAPATGKRDGQEVAYLNFKQHPQLRKVCEDHGITLDSVALYLTILKSLGGRTLGWRRGRGAEGRQHRHAAAGIQPGMGAPAGVRADSVCGGQGRRRLGLGRTEPASAGASPGRPRGRAPVPPAALRGA